MRKKIAFLILCSCVMVFLSACSYEKESDEKVSDLEFTVLKQEEIPEELAEVIEQKKIEPFHVTYEDDALYIAVGYGEQRSGGYSIEAGELYLTKSAICFRTKLIGPGKDELVDDTISYPYLVVKTEKWEERVIFED